MASFYSFPREAAGWEADAMCSHPKPRENVCWDVMEGEVKCLGGLPFFSGAQTLSKG